MLECRPFEQPHLGHIRRAKPGHSAFAFDRLDHRRFLAAYIGASATTELDRRERARRIRPQARELRGEHFPACGVFIAEIDVDLGDIDRPRRDQRAFEKPVRVAFQIIAILEGARLALVDVDREQPRRGFRPHDAPLASGREAGAAQATEARVLHRFQDAFQRPLAGDARRQQRVAPLRAVFVIGGVRRRLGLDGVGADRGLNLGRIGTVDRVLSDHHDGSVVTASNTGRVHHPHVIAERALEIGQELLRAAHGTGQRIADPHRDAGGRGFPILHHVEMMVEGGHLVHLRHGELHFGGERHQVRLGDLAVGVLNFVQVLDQKIPSPRLIPEQRLDLGRRLRIDLASLACPAGGLDLSLGRFQRDDGLTHRCGPVSGKTPPEGIIVA